MGLVDEARVKCKDTERQPVPRRRPVIDCDRDDLDQPALVT
jgi:hypothetical protein